MAGVARIGRWAAGIALAVGYTLLAHYTNTNANPRTETLGTLLALAPIVLAALSLAWHAPYRKTMLALFCAGCAALIATWGSLEHHYSRIYWIEHAGTQLMLCMVFGRTLAPGREPMCTYFAKVVHGSLTPAIERYTRQVTRAWLLFFAAMAAGSTLIYLTAPLAAWSVFANFFTAPLTALMFVAEYAVRRRLHPDMEHAHILAAVKAFWNVPAR
jgi:uncharacterized membrane protein